MIEDLKHPSIVYINHCSKIRFLKLDYFLAHSPLRLENQQCLSRDIEIYPDCYPNQ